MPIYPEQAQAMMNMLGQSQQCGSQNQLMGLPNIPDIAAYEQQIRILPSLALDAEERGKIMAVIQNYYQRTASQQA